MSNESFYPRHQALLASAVDAIRERRYFSPYPESPSPRVYGQDAAERGREAFEAYLGAPFPLRQPGVTGTVSTESSPYGIELGISYPRSDPETLITAAMAATPAWRDLGPQGRAGVCAEILARLNARSFELAHAVMHTTGQAFLMAFQAGGTHAQERGLEAVGYGLDAMTRFAARADWEKPQRRGEPLRLDKTFTVVGRGVGLVIGCTTFPTWNSYPAIFADLVSGNPVIVKPHPGAVLPLAITVAVAREVLAEAGQNPDLVSLAVEEPAERIATTLATDPRIRIVDFTGSTEFGNWLQAHATQAFVNTEKSGTNVVVVDSTDDYRGMLGNLAFSLSLYSGQMCTTPQNIYLPTGGIDTDAGRKSPERFGSDLAAAIDALLADEARAAGTLGAITGPDVLDRTAAARQAGTVVRDSGPVTNPEYPNARTASPLLVTLDTEDADVSRHEHFGPITFIIPTASTNRSLELLRDTVASAGALTAAVYSTDEAVLAAAENTALAAGVNLSENLTGGVFVNQTAAFSDYHGTGANPAATASLTDPAFIGGRFFLVETRRPVSRD